VVLEDVMVVLLEEQQQKEEEIQSIMVRLVVTK
jgi:hypothetical protein